MASSSSSSSVNHSSLYNNSSNNSSNSDSDSMIYGPTPNYGIPAYIYFYGLSVLLPVGLLCNLLCFGVFLTSRSLRRTTTGHYLSALAVADTIFLLGELLR